MRKIIGIVILIIVLSPIIFIPYLKGEVTLIENLLIIIVAVGIAGIIYLGVWLAVD